ncbi:unnamed protein product [Durusdinium trenchii]|uniref:Uncharacterized protein n=1 Tax=Durusdinium trenchii TaxID=1381693 RepID=A0ABP0M6X9_9DINO
MLWCFLPSTGSGGEPMLNPRRWLQAQAGVHVKNIIRHARVPIVMFETEDLEVDISVQQPFGVLNSWHLRDLCRSGLPGRLRALVRLAKQWVKSKAINSAKDGALSSYGWAMLAAGFLQEYGLLPALMDGERQYLTADDALWHVLNAVEAQPEGLWRQPEVYSVDWNSPMEARQRPCELFVSWLEWLQHSAFAPGTSSGSLPIHRRHIVSVRGRSQEELRREVAACPKQDHWNPSSNPVFMLIEEPLTGENVARSVRENAFQDILAELQRALEIMSANDADTAFEETARGSWRISTDATSCFSCQRSDIEKGLLMVLDLAKAQKGQGAFRQAAQAAGWATASWGAVKRLVDSLGRHSPQRSVNHFPQQGLLPSGASGAVLVPADASTPYKDLYIALLRGSSLPDSLVTVRARICSPSEGSKAFRLATRRTEGLAASTLLRPLSIGRVDGLPATLVLLRPKHRAPPVPQQLQLHCVAAGCPVLGDRLHDADRRLDFRFEAPDPSPRLMLHCLRVQVEGQEIRAPEDLRANLEIERELVDLEEAETELMLAEDGPELPDTWDTFAGGLPSQILDDTSWDRLRLPRAVRSPPYGPAQWDERTQAFEERQEARQRPGRAEEEDGNGQQKRG